MSNFLVSSPNEPLASIQLFLSEASREIVLFAPYVRAETLEHLIPETSTKISLVTSWKLHDLWQGSSDIGLYPFTKDHSIKMFINNRIHLKVFMVDWERCVLGSSNISRRGLGIAEEHNFELNVVQSNIDISAQFYLRKILSESVLINDQLYQQYCEKLEGLPEPEALREIGEIDLLGGSELTTSSLPMSREISKLYRIYADNFKGDDQETTDCAIHDIALYKIPFGLDFDGFIGHLKSAFFRSKFIQELLFNIEKQPMYFGQTKAWIQTKCTDVPVPSRRDLTGNVQVLFRWIVDLGGGQYAVDRPNYSEKLYKIKNP